MIYQYRFKKKKLNLKCFLLVIFICFLSFFFESISTGNECGIPPFIGIGVKPNVIIMLDNSGSMKHCMYDDPSFGGWKCNQGTHTDFNPDITYYGIFDPTKKYKYDPTIPVDPDPWQNGPYYINVDTSKTGAFVEDDCTPGSGNNCWDGNFLNWLTTRRIDAARKALVGGKVEDRNGYDYIPGDDGDLEWKILGNNEPSDYSFCKKYSDSSQFSPFPNNTKFKIYSPADSGSAKTIYDPYAKLEVNQQVVTIKDSNGNVIGEAGLISANHEWTTVNFSNNFSDSPIVVVGPLSYEGKDPAVPRLKDVTQTSFKVRVQEWIYEDGTHTTEYIPYMAVKQGIHTLPGGIKLVADKIRVSTVADRYNCGENCCKGETSASWTTVNYGTTLSSPVVKTTIVHPSSENCSYSQDGNSSCHTVTTRIKDVSSTSFKVTLQEEEKLGAHGSEWVNYIAVEQGTVDFGNSVKMKAGTTGDNVTQDWYTIDFSPFNSVFMFIADMQTADGLDTATLRYKDLSSNSVKIFVEEEKSCDSETNHTSENVGYIIFSNGVTNTFNIALVVEEEPKGIVQDVAGKVRLGVSFYRYTKDSNIYNGETADGGTLKLYIPKNPFVKNNSDIGGYRVLNTHVKANVDDIVDAIEHYPLVWGTTPLAENFYELVRYFRQDSPYYCSEDYQVNNDWDSYYYSELGGKTKCAKSFIVVFTDGEPWRDCNVPKINGCGNQGGSSCSDTGPDCDHDGNEPQSSLCSSYSSQLTDYLDDIAYWAHHVDQRSDLDGDQLITTYSVIFGVSEYCSQYDNQTDCEANGCDWMNGQCWPTPQNEKCRKQIMQDTADNGGGRFYYAADGEQLAKAFTAIMESIIRTGAAGSVATVTQEVAGEDVVIRGAFTTYNPDDPNTYIWKGHLEAYWPYRACSELATQTECESEPACEWINNSCQEKCSNYTSESSCGTVLGCSWNDNTNQCIRDKYSFESSLNQGKFCTDSGFQGGHCWDAGEKLSNQGSRTIFTFINNQKIDFTFENVKDHLDLDSECDFNGDGNVDDNDKQKLVNWIIGTEDGDGIYMRDRNGWLLGDIVYSTPLVVGQPSLGSVPKAIAKDSCKVIQPCFQYKNESDCTSHLNDYGCYWDRINGTCEAMDCSQLNGTICNNQPVCQWNATEGVCEEKTVSSDSCFYTWRLKNTIAHRKKVIYVGANDGMLHAFVGGVWWQDPDPSVDSDGDGEADESHWIYNSDEPDSLCDGYTCTGKEDIGKELWSYIPSNLLSELKELAKPTYGKEAGCQHKTMVDLSPEAWDVNIDLDNDGVKEWHTILIGGERGGGDVYFAIDVTDPEDPQVLWEFSTLRNMVYVYGSNGSYSADMPYLDKSIYNQIKTIAASWSNPYVGKIKIPDNYCFYSTAHISPLDNNPSNLTARCYGSSQYPLSGWFAFIGGGVRVFDTSYELISGDNGASYYPYFMILDIKTGTNIFQFLWPMLRAYAGITNIPQNSNYIPYAVSNPIALDIWDENGNIGQDGYIDHIYAGDLNGNFYGIELSPNNRRFHLAIDIWNTKPISSSHVNDNYYRGTKQPITVTPTAAFDYNYNLMLYFGTGKFDNVVTGGNDDKTDKAKMSFYALKDSSTVPSTVLPECQPIGSSPPFTINCTFPSGIVTVHGCSSFNSNCTWVKDDGTPDCCEANCSSSCYSCIYDFINEGERVLDSALVAGELVFVTTYIPSDDPCTAGGYGYLYVFDYMCRPLTKNPLENADLQYEHLSQTGWTPGAPSEGGTKAYRANLGKGMPSKPVLDSGGEHVLVQTSDAKIHRIKVKLPQNPLYLKGWKEKE